MLKYYPFLLLSIFLNCRPESSAVINPDLETGAQQTGLYLSELKGKAVGIVANHTTLIKNTHLTDSLLSIGVNIVKIFAPEHGFRGSAGAGDLIIDTRDSITGKPVISLYGSSMKPKAEDLTGIDVMLYDIQDVGVRFYTYISTMHYVMEACAEQGIPLIILDRPNPLGQYIDGPVLDTTSYKSFVGMHPIPVVYGMTVGELAKMINGERWLKGGVVCNLQVIPCANYDHQSEYSLPVNPSPNLRSMEAIYLYPSVCFFEGTIMSLGRGTDTPFRVVGHPDYPDKSFSFLPQVNEANSDPVFNGKICYGIDLRILGLDSLKNLKMINMDWLISVYRQMKKRDDFFTGYFDKLAGTASLRTQIISGHTAEEIKAGWQPQLDEFKKMRKKYLLYKDFE